MLQEDRDVKIPLHVRCRSAKHSCFYYIFKLLPPLIAHKPIPTLPVFSDLCINGSRLVSLLGIIDGGHDGHQGGEVNYLCLPLNPKYDKQNDGLEYAGYVYGTEDQFVPFKKNLQDYKTPCAVWFAKSRGSMLMMPVRNDLSIWLDRGVSWVPDD